MTTYEMITTYLNEMSVSLAAGSEGFYQAVLYDFAKTCKELNKAGVVKHIAELKDRGNNNNTIRTKLTIIKGFTRWALANGYADADYALSVKMPGAEQHISDRMNKEEVQTMLHGARPKHGHNAIRNKAIMELAIVTASRVSAICQLKLSDIDFENKTVRLTHTKRNKDIELAITDSLCANIRDYVENERPAELGADDYLFIGERKDDHGNYRPLSRQQVFNISKQYTKNACGRALSPHKLRHTSATLQIESGTLTIDEISKNLGHSSIATTQRYAQRLNDKNRKTATAAVFEGL